MTIPPMETTRKMSRQPRSKWIKKQFIASAIILALVFGLGGWWMLGPQRTNETEETTGTEDTVELSFQHPLTGERAAAQIVPPRVYAVMIDNAVDAWPASGVDKAFLVIEAPVEAAIPRLEAFFSADVAVEKIGPVRSARPYFVEWASEFDALYAHVGGSDDALELIASTGAFDLNEFYNAASFWRSYDRYAPHNVYISTELLAAAFAKGEERGRAPEVLYGTWKFKNQTEEEVAAIAVGGEGTKGVEVLFNSDLYAVDWEYDVGSGAYLRSQGGVETFASDGVRLTANNVAVMVTDMEVVDYVGRREVRTIGEGKAWVLQDGKTTEATWKKLSASERLTFYDIQGSEVVMNAGNTWIEVVEDEADVKIE